MRPVARMVALTLVCAVFPVAAYAQDANGAAALSHGRGLYYGLGRRGFAGAECQIRFDWDVMFGQQRTPQNAASFALLDQLRFALTVSDGGTAKVEGTDPGAAQHPQSSAAISQLFEGMGQALSGFFMMWSPFMVSSPLPGAATPTAVTSTAGGYLVRYKDGAGDVSTTLRPDGEITRVAVKSPEFESILLPRFDHAPNGLVLSGYQADYTPSKGKGVVHVDADMDYQTVSGLQFPSLLDIASRLDGEPYHLRMHLEGCSVKRKAP